ncbi:hypothetical protein TSUD_375120 [Trifolium subterraneum]|uniref:Uncharacterized protein n=1 Tax=Trifolium subterraneum TaxID=3900 RepID=A0A2Z6NFM6_TRISU|nr:hypothetical protein TSUD_375120 [Trifolium subterraneum]
MIHKEAVTMTNIETDKITTAKSISVVPVQSPIRDMTPTTPRGILIKKENEFTKDIHNDKVDNTIQHQESETDNKHYNDEHGKENGCTVSVRQQEKVSVCSNWSDDSAGVPETQVEKSASNYPIDMPESTQNIVILPDEDLDEVVQADLRVIKQAWAAMEKGEKPFTPVISQSSKKKIIQLARSVGKSNNTRFRGDTSHRSL